MRAFDVNYHIRAVAATLLKNIDLGSIADSLQIAERLFKEIPLTLIRSKSEIKCCRNAMHVGVGTHYGMIESSYYVL